jgi:NAD(P)-dependent dehydrogenase (short-subunit alcohol dehydrogenase family)
VLETAAALEDRGHGALGLRCDVTDEHEVDRCVQQAHDRFGRIDILVNNAGLHQRKYNQPFGSLSRNEVRALFEVNVMGIINCSLACQPTMAAGGGGAIVNIASVSANASRTPYGVSKLAARGVTAALAAEFAADNIRVNAISPGYVGSSNALAECTPDRLVAIMAALGTVLPPDVIAKCSSEDLVSIIRSLQLVPREGRVDDVVQALLYLCSDEAGYVTGETIKVAGGAAIGF